MEAIRKQASKFREQVAKQQQAILKQLGHFGNEADHYIDEAELQCHQQLQNLYKSTRAAKHFQRNIVRGVEAFNSTSSKQMEIVKRLAEDCCRYSNENETDSSLARAAFHFGTSHNSMENERETLFGLLTDQVSEPLRVLITGAPLEDARLLTHRYDRLRQEVESQAADVLRRKSKSRDASTSAEFPSKIQSAETKLSELKSTMMSLGREATDAMLSVEAQQQRITFKGLRTMVDAERSYHQSIISILEKLHAEMILEKQLSKSLSRSETVRSGEYVPSACEDTNLNESVDDGLVDQNSMQFIARVIHPFDAQAYGELNLSVDDYVVVRKVGPNGWSEGECKGKVGWFPSAYIERQDTTAPTESKVNEGTT